MPTRQGWSTMVVAVVAAIIGYLFGIVELYVIAAAMIVLALGAWAAVRFRRPQLDLVRRFRPAMFTQGTPGRAELAITNHNALRSPVVKITEPIGAQSAATLEVGSIPPGQFLTVTYPIPTKRRGVFEVGPLLVTRSDPFHLAGFTMIGADTVDAIVAPIVYDVAMPRLGGGRIGRQLLATARRLGPGEFHALRDYVDGDELRSIHWKASARSDSLKVRQYEMQHLHRCTVVLDTAAPSYSTSVDDRSADAFERAVSCAASLLVSASAAELNTRLVIPPSVDARGPDVAPDGLRALAATELDRDTPAAMLNAAFAGAAEAGEGLGLLIVVTGSTESQLWRAASTRRDPTTTPIAVCTASAPRAISAIDATSLNRFVSSWSTAVGSHAPSTRPAFARGGASDEQHRNSAQVDNSGLDNSGLDNSTSVAT